MCITCSAKSWSFSSVRDSFHFFQRSTIISHLFLNPSSFTLFLPSLLFLSKIFHSQILHFLKSLSSQFFYITILFVLQSFFFCPSFLTVTHIEWYIIFCLPFSCNVCGKHEKNSNQGMETDEEEGKEEGKIRMRVWWPSDVRFERGRRVGLICGGLSVGGILWCGFFKSVSFSLSFRLFLFFFLYRRIWLSHSFPQSIPWLWWWWRFSLLFSTFRILDFTFFPSFLDFSQTFFSQNPKNLMM